MDITSCGSRLRRLLPPSGARTDDARPRRILHLGRANGMTVRIEEIDHTADVGIRVFGSTSHELCGGPALGMFARTTHPSRVKPKGEIEVRVSADDLSALLVAWLSELLVLHET